MKGIGWNFSLLASAPQEGFTNNDVVGFKGKSLMDNFAREICQNSLDAHNDDNNDPVKVVFELRYVKSDYNIFKEYAQCIAGCRAYWNGKMDPSLKRFVEGAEKALAKESIPVMVVSDYNTSGLYGSRSDDDQSPWYCLVKSIGVTAKKTNTSGGSYGIGKNAPYACSALSMVCYNTKAEDGESAFIGASQMATMLNKDGKPTHRNGRYQNNDDVNEKWLPVYPEDKEDFRDLFQRDEQGTDVIVTGFNQIDDWDKKITKAVINNFFVAICEKHLVVEVKDDKNRIVIDASTIVELYKKYSKENSVLKAYQLYTAFTAPDYFEHISIFEKDDVDVYVKVDADYKQTVANFRNTGMLVGNYSKRIGLHYAVVVVVRGTELDALLRETEPPCHDKWDFEQIDVEEKDKRKRAKNAINQIASFVKEFLKSKINVVTEDIVDAVGVGEYLPDDVEGGFGEKNEDSLKVKVKIDKVSQPKKRTITNTVTPKLGVDKSGNGKNTNKGGNTNPPRPKPLRPRPPVPKPPRPPKPSVPDNSVTVITDGKETVLGPDELIAQRAFPVDVAKGAYRIVVKPKRGHNQLYVTCFAVGEDGKKDALGMSSFTCNGNKINVKNGKAGPIKVAANAPAVFLTNFDKKEKMKVQVVLTEVTKK